MRIAAALGNQVGEVVAQGRAGGQSAFHHLGRAGQGGEQVRRLTDRREEVRIGGEVALGGLLLVWGERACDPAGHERRVEAVTRPQEPRPLQVVDAPGQRRTVGRATRARRGTR